MREAPRNPICSRHVVAPVVVKSSKNQGKTALTTTTTTTTRINNNKKGSLFVGGVFTSHTRPICLSPEIGVVDVVRVVACGNPRKKRHFPTSGATTGLLHCYYKAAPRLHGASA